MFNDLWKTHFGGVLVMLYEHYVVSLNDIASKHEVSLSGLKSRAKTRVRNGFLVEQENVWFRQNKIYVNQEGYLILTQDMKDALSRQLQSETHKTFIREQARLREGTDQGMIFPLPELPALTELGMFGDYPPYVEKYLQYAEMRQEEYVREMKSLIEKFRKNDLATLQGFARETLDTKTRGLLGMPEEDILEVKVTEQAPSQAEAQTPIINTVIVDSRDLTPHNKRVREIIRGTPYDYVAEFKKENPLWYGEFVKYTTTNVKIVFQNLHGRDPDQITVSYKGKPKLINVYPPHDEPMVLEVVKQAYEQYAHAIRSFRGKPRAMSNSWNRG